jgi:cardiolipin synthase A/B
VRVLIDATGTFFSWPAILGSLRRAGVRYARFLPAFSLLHPVSLNLRNHRKLLIVDGKVGFTGGMNIMAGHWWSKRPLHLVQDIHFRVFGPVVAQLREAFADDWFFTTGEALKGERWFPPLAPAGTMFARGIADGPDEDFEKTRWAILGALAVARRSVRILTPYFLPDTAITSALNVAAMRGVDVRIMLPSSGDVPFVQWASTAQWWQLLEHGCRLWIAPPPFDHGKLFIVDEQWVLLGSSNWDPRSLRLNFEFNLECYSPGFAAELADWYDRRMRWAREISLEETDARALPIKVRDGLARLLTPFL